MSWSIGSPELVTDWNRPKTLPRRWSGMSRCCQIAATIWYGEYPRPPQNTVTIACQGCAVNPANPLKSPQPMMTPAKNRHLFTNPHFAPLEKGPRVFHPALSACAPKMAKG